MTGDAFNNTVHEHRNTKGLSDLGKHIIASCPHAFVNKWGQVIDPCHMWFGEMSDATSWSLGDDTTR